MKPVRLSEDAEADLEDMADFIARDNPKRALTWVSELKARCDTLAFQPFQGRPFPVVAPDARLLPYRTYLILYRVFDDHVAIDRITHGARDVPSLLGRSRH